MEKISSANIIESTAFRPWEVASEPFEIVKGLYYVGNAWVGSYLIDSGEGLILLDTTVSETCYQVIDNIYKLGLDPKSIKFILLSHAHVDHTAAASQIQGISNAKIFLSREDEEFRHDPIASFLEHADEQFKNFSFNVDEYYDNQHPICLGNVKIQTILTPGHTPGTTSFIIHLEGVGGKRVTAAMHGGVGINTMSEEAFRKSGLPVSLRGRFIEDCQRLKEIHVDICLPSHPTHAPFLELVKLKTEQDNPFVDDSKWAKFLEMRASYARELVSSQNNSRNL